MKVDRPRGGIVGLLSDAALTACVALGVALSACAQETPEPGTSVRAAQVKGLMQPLVGMFRVSRVSYTENGSSGPSERSDDLVVHRRFVAGGRYVEEEMEGSIGAQRYWRLGLLGYNTAARRYEIGMVDDFASGMVLMTGASDGGNTVPLIDVKGSFVGVGLLGQGAIGDRLTIRTTVSVVDRDRHYVDVYLTAPGAKEFLADHCEYVRLLDDGAASRKVRSADERFVAAAASGDVLTLKTLLADDFVSVTPTGALLSRDGALAAYGAGSAGPRATSTRNVHIRVDSGHAIITGEQFASPFTGAGEVQHLQRFTRVYDDDEGTWRLRSAHASEVVPGATKGRGLPALTRRADKQP